MWKVLLPATPEGGPYTLTATLGSDTITLSDLLFGDVWLCSGQSNMEMQTYKVKQHQMAIAIIDPLCD